MTKQFSSVLSTDQLIQLGHEILNAQDRRHIEALMKAHSTGSTPNWNRQELIAFIASRNGGTSPDQIVRNRDDRVAQSQKPTHAPPTSAPPEPSKRRVAVFVPCFSCGRDVAIPEDKADQTVFCSDACRNKTQMNQSAAVVELTKFMEEVGTAFYDCDHNTNLMINYLRDHKLTLKSESLLDAFLALRSSGQLLTTLTADQIRDFSPAEYDRRSKLENSDQTGVMGGVDLKTMQMKKGAPSIHSSNSVKTFDLPRQGYTGGAGR
jgi:hypothetical protein